MPSLSYKDCSKIGRIENINSEWKANGVSTDSRDIHAGDLFFALHGEKFDGHDFVKNAIRNGAAGCVVANEWFSKNKREFP